MTRMLVPVSTVVEIDLGELYAPLMGVAIDEVRSIKEQILYYIKQSLKSRGIEVKKDINKQINELRQDVKDCLYYSEVNYRRHGGVGEDWMFTKNG